MAGDDYNDLEMIKNCGFGIAVSNAIEEVKSIADYISDTNDNDGVAKWINNNILSNDNNNRELWKDLDEE